MAKDEGEDGDEAGGEEADCPECGESSWGSGTASAMLVSMLFVKEQWSEICRNTSRRRCFECLRIPQVHKFPNRERVDIALVWACSEPLLLNQMRR